MICVSSTFSSTSCVRLGFLDLESSRLHLNNLCYLHTNLYSVYIMTVCKEGCSSSSSSSIGRE